MEKREVQISTQFNIREETDKRYLEGYFILFNDPTEIYPGYTEQIAPNSVDKSLLENDIKVLFNHNSGTVLGRTGNNTATLTKTETGIFASVEINTEDTEANNILARVKRGDITGCSFGFYPLQISKVNGINVVEDMDLREISVVTFPAYPNTSIFARAREKDLEEWKEKTRGRLNAKNINAK